jgi:hypothetical protein
MKLTRLWFVATVVLLDSLSFGQINALTPTEQTNVTLVLNNLNQLIQDGRALLPQSPTTKAEKEKREAAEKEIKTLEEIHANLAGKLKAGKIRSVLRLKAGVPKKYRHGQDQPSSPTAAYCDDETFIRNGNNWVQCNDGDIVVDHDILDPGNGTAIDETAIAGWKQKWTLMHVLAHEKMHEILINKQIEILKKREWWKFKTPDQKKALIKDAKRKGSTADKHKTVYEWQKNVLRWEQAVLERRLKDLQAQANPDAARVDDLKKKIEWLKKEISSLETKMAKATAGEEAALMGCALPADLSSGMVRVYTATDGLYWRSDCAISGREVTGCSVGETVWLGQRVMESPDNGAPQLIFAMREDVFTGLTVQPDSCGFAQEQMKTGNLLIFKHSKLVGRTLHRLAYVPEASQKQAQ